jgi:hypothetical protein
MSPKSRSDGLLIAAALLLAGCRQDMHDQPKIEPLEPSDFFRDGRGARPPVEHTIARGQLRIDRLRFEGRSGESLTAELPYPVTRPMLERGRQRYDAFCAPCHARTGAGDGMIVQRGYPRPPALYEQRLVDEPIGHLFEVMTNGFGAMPSFASLVPPDDRWAVAAYIRVLQRSRRASLDDVPADVRGARKRGLK